jgi:protein arginine N-methyltransferase 1
MYSVRHYGWMATDAVRMDAYSRAIERVVRPGCTVLDVGAGTGILSLLALRAGAKHVHAVEPNPAIWLLPDIARENGLEGRVTIHPVPLDEVKLGTLGTRADVVVSDLRGSFPLHEAHVAVLRDAKARLLRPGGALLPVRDELFVGVIEEPNLVAWCARATAAFERRGWKAEAARRSVLNTVTNDENELRASALLTQGGRWGHVVYGTDDVVTEGAVSLPVLRGGTAHALAVWFEATIWDDLRFSNAPGTAMAYTRILLPLAEPVELVAGDDVQVLVRTTETGERWAWETKIVATDGKVKSTQRQATFFGMPTSPEALVRASSKFTPSLSVRGERAKLVLDAMDGKRTVAEIAARVGENDSALDEVRKLVASYGR